MSFKAPFLVLGMLIILSLGSRGFSEERKLSSVSVKELVLIADNEEIQSQPNLDPTGLESNFEEGMEEEDEVVVSPEDLKKAKAFVEEGIKLYQEKQYEQAKENLEQALTIDPTDPELNHYLGLVEYALGNYEASVFAFERVLFIDPKKYPSRLELAKSLLAQGNKAKAKKNFEMVLREKIPLTVRANIGLYLSQINSEEKHSFSGAFLLGHMFDSNATQGTGPIALFPGSDFLSAPTQSSDRIVTGALVMSYLYKLDNPEWMSTTSLALMNSNYDRNNSLSSELIQGKTGLSYSKDAYQVDASVNWTGIWLDGNVYQFNPGVNVNYSYLFSGQFSMNFVWDYFRRHFFQAPVGAGDNNSLGLINTQQIALTYISTPQTVWNLSLGHTFDKSPATNETTQSNNKYEATLSMSHQFNDKWSLNMSALKRKSYYNQFDTVETDTKRKDTTLGFKSSVTYMQSSSMMWDFMINNLDNNSNITRNVYMTQQASLSVTYLF
jgi:tetratricopeptide (TPR) repeat protein